MSKNNKIAFFFPSHTIGGVEFLYSRVASQLSKIGYEVEVVDYPDGILFRNLANESKKISFVEYSKDKPIELKGNVCITSLKYLPYAKEIFPRKVKLIFWDEHPLNLVYYLKYTRLMQWFGHNFFIFFSFFFNRKKLASIKEKLKKAFQKNGVAFMCKDNYMLNRKYFGIKNEPYYVPIPIIQKDGRWNKKIDNEVINCSYLGRLDSDKYTHCLELMNDVINFNKKNSTKLLLHIIGNGDKFDLIKILADKHPDIFILKGTLTGSELDNYFLSHIDLSFAVGTSALESAILGIPTVFMRGLSHKLTDKYIWVFDATFHELSLQVFHYKEKADTVLSIGQLISQLKFNSNKLSVQCNEYVLKNHSMSFVTDQLEVIIEKSQLEVDDL